MRKEDQKLIIEAAPAKSLLAVLATLEALDEIFHPCRIRLPTRLICDAVFARHYPANCFRISFPSFCASPKNF